MTDTGDRLAAAVQARLVRHAKAIGADPNVVLVRYATERLLYRLSRSEHAGRFILKGALLLLVWLGETFRPTRGADLLGFGDLSDEALVAIFQGLCSIDVEPDGLGFDASSVKVAEIRPQDEYGGKRVILLRRLGPARLRLQVDVGIGDAVEPAAEWLEYPTLLGQPRPRLRAYRPETVIAEKLHAMVLLAARNSRMRDFFDIHALAARQPFKGWTARPGDPCDVRSSPDARPRRCLDWADPLLRGTTRQAHAVDGLLAQERDHHFPP